MLAASAFTGFAVEPWLTLRNSADKPGRLRKLGIIHFLRRLLTTLDFPILIKLEIACRISSTSIAVPVSTAKIISHAIILSSLTKIYVLILWLKHGMNRWRTERFHIRLSEYLWPRPVRLLNLPNAQLAFSVTWTCAFRGTRFLVYSYPQPEMFGQYK
ncbi:expressed protein [Echinococcus multilocularis]|uniref:Expressed protein n=1 Tax=Echinococcus multilocularis TaxID=6211 RepID=A0A087VYI5_ECHMU|nr:expressed protein [Echinococcus multilocularis]